MPPMRPGACDEALRLDVVTALRECPCEVRALVFRVGLAEPQLTAFAEALAARLRVALGGRYLGKHWDDRAARDTAVRAMFNGSNRDDVMRHFKISKSLFYAILARRPRLG